MSTAKVAITIDQATLARLDQLERSRLARECAKLDPNFEKSLAEEGMSIEPHEWPEYLTVRFAENAL